MPDNKTYFYIKKWIDKNWQLTLMVILPLSFIILFHYVPMYGIQIAFKNYRAVDGIWGSKWVGFDHFIKFFKSYQFIRVTRNTIMLSLYSLIAGFPVPIILAIALNCCKNIKFKKTVQLVTYAPHFISVVVLMGMVIQILSPKYGLLNNLIKALGGEEVLFMAEGRYFRSIYVWSGIWQNMGFSAIIYISALSSVDPTLHEAAIVDGASRLKRVFYIDIPCIVPTIVILLILNLGSIMNVGFEKVLLLQNPTNTEYSEVISTLIYKQGLASAMPQYSYSTAIGIFNSLVNFFLIVGVNTIARKLGETSLW
ncbi:MAG: sugar ABC transporter permease [Clostridiales bacterium]|jgi:putative aldouronate transport system permease protein|nr:sugar ABC transporter permease [Clostridiales bacterium]